MGYTSKYAQDSLAKNGNSDDKLKKAGDKLASKLKKSDDDKKKKKATPQDVQKKKYEYHYNKSIEKQKNAGGTGRGIGSMLKAQKAAEKVTNVKVMRGRK